MRIISRKKLRQFADRWKDAEGPLDAWYRIMKSKRYTTPHEVAKDFGQTDFLGGGRAVFDIGGNKYRLVAHIRYDMGIVFVQKVLTHQEYDRQLDRGTL